MSLIGSTLGTIAAVATMARSTPPRPDSIEVAAPCGSQTELSSRVETLTGLPTHEVAEVIDGWQVTAQHDGYQVEVRVALPDGEHQRRFRAESCEDALDASALILAMALTQASFAEGPQSDTVVPLLPAPPLASLELDAPTRQPDQAPGTPGRPESSSVSVTRPAPKGDSADARPTSRPWLAASIAPSLGSLFARATAGMHGDIAAGFRFLRVAAVADIWFPRKLDAPGDAGARGYGGRLRGWQLGGELCGVPGRRRVHVPLCVGAFGGQLRSRGYGPDLDARTGVRSWRALSLVARPTLYLHERVGLVVGIGTLIPLYAAPINYKVRVDGNETRVYRTPVITLQSYLGVEFNIGRRI